MAFCCPYVPKRRATTSSLCGGSVKLRCDKVTRFAKLSELVGLYIGPRPNIVTLLESYAFFKVDIPVGF